MHQRLRKHVNPSTGFTETMLESTPPKKPHPLSKKTHDQSLDERHLTDGDILEAEKDFKTDAT